MKKALIDPYITILTLSYPSKKIKTNNPSNYSHSKSCSEMDSYIDLRYGIPPFISLLFLFFKLRTDEKEQDTVILPDHYPIILILPFLLLPLVLFLLIIIMLLFISIKLPFKLHRIRLEAGCFSAPVAILLLASVSLSPSLFWILYLVIVITSPFHGWLFNLLNLCLRSIPPLIIGFTVQRPLPSTALAEVEEEEEEVDEISQQAMPLPSAAPSEEEEEEEEEEVDEISQQAMPLSIQTTY